MPVTRETSIRAVDTFDTPADFFEALFGPPQHDAHVTTRRRAMFLRRWEVSREAARQAVRDEAARIAAAYHAKTAALTGTHLQAAE